MNTTTKNKKGKTYLPQAIYPIVDAAFWVDRLGQAGARFIQLRLKEKPMPVLLSEIRQAYQFAQQWGVCLVLNDYWQIALDEGINFVHLGQEDLDTADLTTLHAHNIQIGISTHSHEELDRALTCAPSYVALGPIWETRLKKMAFGPQGTARLTEWKKRIGCLPLVAIGGITLACVKPCLEGGADCVAAVSDFILNPNPEAQVKAWLDAAKI